MEGRWKALEAQLPHVNSLSAEQKAANDTRVEAHRTQVRDMKLT